MMMRSLRKGILAGSYAKDDEQTYYIWFKDAENDVSYKSHPNEQFEYINTTRYNSAMFAVRCVLRG